MDQPSTIDKSNKANKANKANIVFMRFIAITFSVLLVITLIFIRLYGNEWYKEDVEPMTNEPNNKSGYPMEATLISDLYHWDYENRTPINSLDNGNPYIDKGTKFVEPRLGSSFVQEYNRYAVDDKFHPLERNDMLNEKYIKKKYLAGEAIRYPSYGDAWGNVWENPRAWYEGNTKPDFNNISPIAVKD